MCLFKAALSKEGQEQSNLGETSFMESSRSEGKQTPGTALDMHDGHFCAPSTKDFFLQKKSTTLPHMGEQTNPQYKKTHEAN